MDTMGFALLVGVGAALAVPVAYQTVLALLSIPDLVRGAPPRRLAGQARFAILIPAHDEEGMISGAVESVVASNYPRDRQRVFVVADNCTDGTAERARSAGATALERHDTSKRGKPYALNWALKQICQDDFDALVIMDADTVMDPYFLAAMEQHLIAGEQAIQGYFGIMNPDENWLTRLGTLPATVKFRLHFPGKRLLGLSCPLAGNGMVFSMKLIKKFGWEVYSITENWEYYVMLAQNGYRVTPAPEAVIYSQVARSLKLGQTQRVRWMQGQMDILGRYKRALVRQAIRERSVIALDVLVELGKPSHAMLLAWTTIYLAACALWAVVEGHGSTLLLLGAAVLLWLQIAYFLAGLALERPPLRTWLALGMVPWYLMWKMFINLRALIGSKDPRWVKTTRN